jgi:hypothetical protein
MITFWSRRNNGGYGDRLVGMSTACTLARRLQMKFEIIEEISAEEECVHVNLVNKTSSDLIECVNIRELWKDKHVIIQSNTPIDVCLWKNPFFKDLEDVSYENETIQSYKCISKMISRDTIIPHRFVCGVQIRCGDTYCMPHSLAEEYIPESRFSEFSRSIHDYICSTSMRGKIFLTSDTYKIYPFFKKLSNSEIEYVYTEKRDDIHYDFYNSDNRRDEIVYEHTMLQQCERIITGLRSNFGITAAYCSPICQQVILYPSFKTFDTTTEFVSKEFSHKAHS